MSQYIALVLKSGGQPLPVLNRISANKELFLLNYSLNAANVASLSQSFPFIVPANLLKLFLVDNSMDDRRPSQLEDVRPGGQQPSSSNNDRLYN